MNNFINNIYQYRNLIYELVKRDIKKKYRRSVLGIFWSMLNPLLMMLVTAMVFSNIFRFEIKNFAVYLLTGQIIFNFYSESTNFAMGSILDNASLIKKIYVPKYLFPISRVASCGVNLLLTIPAIFVVLLITKQPITYLFICILVPLILLFIFNIGVGLFLSAFTVYFRDMFHLYGVVLSVLTYSTPIFYPENIIPEKYQFIIKLNPIWHYLRIFRDIVYYNQMPSLQLIIRCALISIAALVIGWLFFNKKQKKFILYI
jgi:ABC-2 type transport system permease protein/lipopolysaccharide transport system permease protein